MSTSLPRGVRNNNPGNIRIGVPWDGRKLPNTDGAFDQFEAPEFGIRAMMKLLIAYQDFHGLNTIEGLISRYAPGNENDTAEYIRAVSDSMQVPDTAHLNLHNRETLIALCNAMIRVECSQYVYPDTIMQRAAAMANPGVV